MNRLESNQDWERYARDLEDAWHKEYQRQITAYQQLQIELTNLLKLIQENQQNQSDLMKETAYMYDTYVSDFQNLRQDVMAILNECHTALSRISGWTRPTLVVCRLSLMK